MPIRDVEAFLPRTEKELTVLSNRGANGIDGTASSAAGAALGLGARAFLLTGDLALLHDLAGLLAARRLGADLTVVCANNGGGGIFDFLPVAGAADEAAYEGTSRRRRGSTARWRPSRACPTCFPPRPTSCRLRSRSPRWSSSGPTGRERAAPSRAVRARGPRSRSCRAGGIR